MLPFESIFNNTNLLCLHLWMALLCHSLDGSRGNRNYCNQWRHTCSLENYGQFTQATSRVQYLVGMVRYDTYVRTLGLCLYLPRDCLPIKTCLTSPLIIGELPWHAPPTSLIITAHLISNFITAILKSKRMGKPHYARCGPLSTIAAALPKTVN